MKRWTHLAWGVTYKGKYWPDIKLAYSEDEAWRLGIFKLNCKTRRRFIARGGGVCRVKVIRQQVEACSVPKRRKKKK